MINALDVCLLGNDLPFPLVQLTSGTWLNKSYGLGLFNTLRNMVIKIKFDAGTKVNMSNLSFLFINKNTSENK